MNSHTVKARRRTALAMSAVAALMLGAAFASAPLYDLYCRVTGYGGTPARARAAPGAAQAGESIPPRAMTVRFNADVARDMPWQFQPEARSVKVNVGEAAEIRYRAFNPGPRAIVGTATFNVVPNKAAKYFSKIECFCFEEQRLQPGQSAALPVRFFIDPAILNDPDVAEVETLTLSYTFFVKRIESLDAGFVKRVEHLAAGS
jgi:cytochrome c oxidase assembly protein subunit 11